MLVLGLEQCSGLRKSVALLKEDISDCSIDCSIDYNLEEFLSSNRLSVAFNDKINNSSRFTSYFLFMKSCQRNHYILISAFGVEEEQWSIGIGEDVTRYLC